MDFRERVCEDMNCNELAQDRALQQAL